MKIPEYVTVEEVQRVCKALGLRDWTALEEAKVESGEAAKILAELDVDDMKVDLEDFREGLEVELEHGTRFKIANVTNNHPVLTGKIVLAHFKESLDYYKRLEVAEIEGDLLKALVRNNPAKLLALYKKLLSARHTLGQVESSQLPSD